MTLAVFSKIVKVVIRKVLFSIFKSTITVFSIKIYIIESTDVVWSMLLACWGCYSVFSASRILDNKVTLKLEISFTFETKLEN